ncbi:hypothetical protein C0708_23960 (plasmid) [Aeromonas caviae]|nr:hypothetical protein C0708_23960 [Aeromonas caviae]
MPRAVAALQRAPACDHPPLGARPPDGVAHQVMALSAVPPGDMAQQRPTGDHSSATSPADTAPREVAALLRVPAGVHTPLRARPPDGVAHQVMALSAVPPGDMAMAQQRPTGDPSSATSPADTAPRAVAALQLAPASDHLPLGARPPDRVARQVIALSAVPPGDLAMVQQHAHRI